MYFKQHTAFLDSHKKKTQISFNKLKKKLKLRLNKQDSNIYSCSNAFSDIHEFQDKYNNFELTHDRYHPDFHEFKIDDMRLLDILEMIAKWKNIYGLKIYDKIEEFSIKFKIDIQLKDILINSIKRAIIWKK